MAALEDQCLAPGGNDEKFVSAAYATLKESPKLLKSKVGANLNFIVVHTIGEIPYCASGFLLKNKDVLRAELVEATQQSPSPVVSAMFRGVVIEKGKLAKGQLIGSQFMLQLEKLMALINSTEPHFIRCVKPNESKKPHDWVASKVLIQLHSLSILEALQLRNLGYSYRRPFNEFLYQYKFIDLGISEDPSLEPKVASTRIIERAKIEKEKWAIGHTMVFMKPEGIKDMARKQRECMAAWVPLCQILEANYQKRKTRAQLEKARPSLIRAQAHFRRHAVISALANS